MRILTSLCLLLMVTSPALAYPITYHFTGIAEVIPSEPIPVDRSTNILTGWVSYDTDTVDTPGHREEFSWEFNLGSSRWNSDPNIHIGSMGIDEAADTTVLHFMDEAPERVVPWPDVAFLNLNFSGPMLPGQLLPLENFVGGTFALSNFLFSPRPPDGAYGLRGTITTLTLVPPSQVPEPASIALMLGGLAGMIAVRRRTR